MPRSRLLPRRLRRPHAQSTNKHGSGRTQQVQEWIRQNNLIYGVTTDLGGSGWAFLIGDGVRDLAIDRNTIDFNGTTLLYAYVSGSTIQRAMPGFRFTGNATRHGQYGINGGEASTGTLTLQMYFPGSVITGNWLSGGSSSRYPAGNRFEEPFELDLNPATAATAQLGPGTNVRMLLIVIDSVVRGLPMEVPVRPDGVRIIW